MYESSVKKYIGNIYVQYENNCVCHLTEFAKYLQEFLMDFVSVIYTTKQFIVVYRKHAFLL